MGGRGARGGVTKKGKMLSLAYSIKNGYPIVVDQKGDFSGAEFRVVDGVVQVKQGGWIDHPTFDVAGLKKHLSNLIDEGFNVRTVRGYVKERNKETKNDERV